MAKKDAYYSYLDLFGYFQSHTPENESKKVEPIKQ